MIKFFKNEKWKEITLDDSLQLRYAVSNRGRVLSFIDKFRNGRLLRGGTIEGYKIIRWRVQTQKRTLYQYRFFHKLVAMCFLKKKSNKQVYVLHLNRDRGNNSVKNLKWATKEEMLAHSRKSPLVIAAKKKLIKFNRNRPGHKLNAAKVKILKKRIFNPKRRTTMKMIAKQAGISEMQLYRIKSGENWGHIRKY